uniref:Uncharacterized protein n=1 Tax=Anguilla anguilla TaxID=7936 RepID=A0A0E9UNI5_ANGAN
MHYYFFYLKINYTFKGQHIQQAIIDTEE